MQANQKAQVTAALVLLSVAVSFFLVHKHQNDERANAYDQPVTLNEDSANNPSIAINSSGEGVIAWEEKDGLHFDIYVQQFDSDGLIGEPVVANQFTVSQQLSPDVAIDDDGHFVAVWQSLKQDAGGTGIFGQRFSNKGQKIGVEFRANSFQRHNQSQPVVAMRDNGEFVVAWVSEKQDGSSKSIFAQFYEEDGSKKGAETAVNAQSAGAQTNPAIANSGANILIAWQSTTNSWDIYAQAFNWAGKRLLDQDALINSAVEYEQTFPSISSGTDGVFTISWMNQLLRPIIEVIDQNILAQDVNALGKLIGGPMELMESNFKRQDQPVTVGKEVIWRLADKNGWHFLHKAVGSNLEPLQLTQNDPDINEINSSPDAAVALDGSLHVVWMQKDPETRMKNVVYRVF